MAFFTSSEQRERSAVFDELIENTDVALRHPDTKKKLGKLARQLLVINAQAFLPNMRGGRYRVPLQYRKAPYTAVVPVTDNEAPSIYEKITPLLSQYPLSRRIDRTLTSRPYKLKADPQQFRTISREKPFTSGGIESLDTAARTMTWFWPTEDYKRMSMSRPVELVRHSITDRDPWGQAAILAHEHVHAHDAITDGPLYLFNQYTVVTEARAYHVTESMRDKSASMADSTNAIAVESLRRRFANPKYPFAYSPELASALERGDAHV